MLDSHNPIAKGRPEGIEFAPVILMAEETDSPAVRKSGHCLANAIANGRTGRRAFDVLRTLNQSFLPWHDMGFDDLRQSFADCGFQ